MQSDIVMELPVIGQFVLYRTDGRNGLCYDLPALITCTRDSHPGDYPSGARNPLPKPDDDFHVHLTVFSPGGFGTTIGISGIATDPVNSADFVGAPNIIPGSGTYVEWNVPAHREKDMPRSRTWRYM